MERAIQVTSGRTYIFNFKSFAIRVDGQTSTVPITLEQMTELESDPGVKGLIDAGEIVLHNKPSEGRADDSIQPTVKARGVRSHSVEDA